MRKFQISNFKFLISNERDRRAGFTVVELLVIMGIVIILFLLVSMTFSDARSGTGITTTSDTLLSDLKLQQTKAMIGDTEGRGSPDAYGVYITNGNYILFHGTSYIPSDPENFTVKSAEGVNFATTFPGLSVVFATKSGEIVNYTAGQDQIMVKDANTTKQKTIQLNKLGTVVSVQ